MQKAVAILLLIPLAALSIEWSKALSFCTPTPTCNTLTLTCERNAVSNTEHDCCNDGSCKKAGKSSGEHPQGCAAHCMDCPLCTPVTFQPFCRFEFMLLPDKPEYTVMPIIHLSDFARQQWKPPDTSIIS